MLDHHLCEMISLNVLALLKCKKVIAQATRVTSYGDCHAVINTSYDMQLVVDHLMKQKTFHDISKQDMGNQPKKSYIDFFFNRTSKLQLEVPLKRYKL